MSEEDIDLEELTQKVAQELRDELQNSPSNGDTDATGGVNSTVNKLRREKADVVDEMRELRDEIVEAEEPEQEKLDRFDELEKKAEQLGQKIDTAERTSSFSEPDTQQVTDRDVRVDDNLPPRDSDKYKTVYRKWMAEGMKGLRTRERDIMLEHRDREAEKKVEERALTTEVGSSGGFLVPEEMESALTEAIKATGGMREAPTQNITTANGRTMDIPQWDDTSQTGQIIKEDGSYSKTDPSTSQQKLDSFIYTSDEIEVSMKELRDVIVDNFEGRLGDALGKRIARARNTKQTTGQGGDEPRGVVTASSKGTATDSAGALSYVDFLDMENAIDEAFHRSSAFQLTWMMNSTTRKEVKNITDSNNNPIFFEPQDGGDPSILGYPLVINEDMANVGAGASGNKSVLFGAFERYWIRDVEGMGLFRIPVEAKLAADQKRNVGFVAFQEGDADLNDPGDNPVQHLETS